jgi:(p)ppGpp synthase/HD superfamily hydrolase
MHMEQHYTVEQVLDAIWLLKQEKWVDTILNSVKEKIFSNDLNTENVEEFKKFVRRFTSLYYLMKDKFSEVERTSWERYFEHLREVVNNILKLPNPNTKKVLIAIAHDSIEDTNKTFEWLSEDYWYDVALAVQAISKEPWKKYQDLSIENEAERIKNAKKQRNITYFWHLQSFETFKSHIANLAKEKWIELTEEKLIEITRNALDVKFADRIHNLSTQWDPSNLEQVRKKIDETKKFFLGIAHETNNEAHEQIKTLLLTLELRLQDTSWKVTALLGGE